uniref:Uncharacterized protein n=1 Tax=Arundo donax TaxID=35708 RepID=A0A0A8YZI2_ARUDO
MLDIEGRGKCLHIISSLLKPYKGRIHITCICRFMATKLGLNLVPMVIQ